MSTTNVSNRFIADDQVPLEGPIARLIEHRTARLPSDLFLWTAIGAVGLSLSLELAGRNQKANFVAHWAPTLLLFGVYNKLVKVLGSDRAHPSEWVSQAEENRPV